MQLTTTPKLAFFDIDGTLIGKSGLISERTKKALFALRAKGVHLALATGRPLFGAKKIAKELEIDCLSLFSSGSLLANPKENSSFFEAAIDRDLLKQCVKLSVSLGLYTELYSRDAYFIEKTTDITHKHQEYLGISPIECSFDEIISSHSINKIVTISDNPELDQKQNLLINKMSGLICLCSKGASHPEITFNNITSTAANRANGFKLITEALNVRPDEVLAFGDAISDLCFIESAGFGVAMKEAPKELRDKARFTTDSAENDGVAQVVEKIVSGM